MKTLLFYSNKYRQIITPAIT